MDTGKTMTGTALVMRLAGLMMTPAGAAGCCSSCLVGNRHVMLPADLPMPCALVEQDPAHVPSVVPAGRERIP
jgi:hypothetical protein